MVAAVRRLLDPRLRLVVRPLLALQFLVEERRQILPLPAHAAAARAWPVRDLAAPNLRLRLKQPLQRRHLVGERVARSAAVCN